MQKKGAEPVIDCYLNACDMRSCEQFVKNCFTVSFLCQEFVKSHLFIYKRVIDNLEQYSVVPCCNLRGKAFPCHGERIYLSWRIITDSLQSLGPRHPRTAGEDGATV